MKISEDEAGKFLRKIGFEIQLAGYKYMKTAMVFMLEEEKEVETQIIYQYVSIEHGVRPNQVSGAVRNAIEKSFLPHNRTGLQRKIFGSAVCYKRGNPTNKEFFTSLEQYLLRKSC